MTGSGYFSEMWLGNSKVIAFFGKKYNFAILLLTALLRNLSSGLKISGDFGSGPGQPVWRPSSGFAILV
jgi:hypothetical protein